MGATNKENSAQVEDEAFNYDVVLDHIGEMGRFQLTTCLWLLIPALFSGVIVMSYTFTGAIPQFRCEVDGCDDSTDFNWSNYSLKHNLKDSCFRYNLTVTDPILHCDPHNISSIEPGLLQKCDKWIFDTSTFQSTIFTEFSLPCDNEWKATLIGTMYMVGMFIGGLTLSNLADIIGRRYALTISGFLTGIVMTASAFSPNVMTFAVLRLFCGICGVSDFLICFVWGVEATGKKYRTLVGFIYQMMFAVGSGLLGLAAYYVRDWRTLQLVISIPMFSMALIAWFLPESTRWLITKKRYSAARTIILRAAEINNKHVPEHLLIPPSDSNEEDEIPSRNRTSMTSMTRIVDEVVNKEEDQPSENMLIIIRSALLARRLVILFLGWMTVTISYYGLTFSLGNLSGNYYVNYELIIFVEIPGSIIGIYLMDKIGRRMTVSGSMFMSGIACLTAGLVPPNPGVYRMALLLLGKLFISCCFGGIYSYTTELFPTAVRGATIGFCSTFGRIGGIMAPIIADVGRNVDPTLPYIIFAIISITVAILCFTLPETNNVPLPSNIQEAKELKTNWNFCSNCRQEDSVK